MPVGAYEMIRHAKFDLGQEVTAELECASMFMTREQKDKVGPYSYNWAHSPAAAWQSIADGVADFLVLERSEEHTSELQSLMRISYAVFCLKKKKKSNTRTNSDTKIEKHTYQLPLPQGHTRN